MKKNLEILWIGLIPLTVSGCESVGDIFKTGMLSGVIIIIAIIAVITYIFKLFAK